MKRLFGCCSLLVALATFSVSEARADAVNEKRVLRKAGGVTEGTLTNVILVTTPFGGGPPVQTTSFDRTGSVRVPAKPGTASAVVDHGGPEAGFDTETSGTVSKAAVKRRGKLIKYAGQGANEYFDGEGSFTGGGNATATIRGAKVISSAVVNGSRVNTTSMDTEAVTANAAGKGKF